MIWPFNRKQQNTVPTEFQDYYKSEKQGRVGLAWLLAASTLLVTVAVALGLFFGGRFVYRRFIKDTPVTTQTAQPSTNQQPQGVTSLQSTDNTSPSNLQAGSQTNSSGAQNQPPQTGNAPASPSTQVPRTGPDEDL